MIGTVSNRSRSAARPLDLDTGDGRSVPDGARLQRMLHGWAGLAGIIGRLVNQVFLQIAVHSFSPSEYFCRIASTDSS
jgi:hypothetical protein